MEQEPVEAIQIFMRQATATYKKTRTKLLERKSRTHNLTRANRLLYSALLKDTYLDQ